MNTLLSIRANILYNKKAKDETLAPGDDGYNKYHELVFLVDKPIYSRTNSGEIIRGVEEMRFVVSDDAFAGMIDVLTQLKSAEEEDLA